MNGFHSDDSNHRDIELSYPLIAELNRPAIIVVDNQSHQDIELSYPLFAEQVCPACFTVSARIPVDDRIEQRTFDDVHRRCYIYAVPPLRD